MVTMTFYVMKNKNNIRILKLFFLEKLLIVGTNPLTNGFVK